jgi:glycosyltransferase involved in cell wall biosynthesis
LFDPIYQQREIDVLRGNASMYIHGHSAGGTNPSLVEAMFLGLPIFSFDVSYNKTTTEHNALYFSSANELINSVRSQSKLSLQNNGNKMKAIAQRRYTWKLISAKYEKLIQEALATDKKNSIFPDINKLDANVFEEYNINHLKNTNSFYEKR